MMKRVRNDLVFYFILLFASAALALWASLPQSENELRQIKITEIDPGEVSQVKWSTTNGTTIAVRRPGDSKFWIKTGNDSFLANPRLEETLSTFDPLYAQRLVANIESPEDPKLASFGLNPPTATLSIMLGGVPDDSNAKSEGQEKVKELQILLGRNSFGTTDRYLLTPDGKNVVLIAGDAISGFDNPVARFFERTVFPTKLDESDTAEVTDGELTKTFEGKTAAARSRNPEDDGKSSSDQDPGGKFGPAFDEWLDRAERLRGIRYASQEAEEKLANIQPALELKFVKNGAKIEEITFKTLPADSNKGNPTWWVVSTTTKAHMEISANRAEPLVKDAIGLLKPGESAQ